MCKRMLYKHSITHRYIGKVNITHRTAHKCYTAIGHYDITLGSLYACTAYVSRGSDAKCNLNVKCMLQIFVIHFVYT